MGLTHKRGHRNKRFGEDAEPKKHVPPMPMDQALWQLFQHTFVFMMGVILIVIAINMCKRCRKRRREQAIAAGEYGTISEVDPMDPATEPSDDLEESALVTPGARTRPADAVLLSQVLLDLKLERYQRGFDRCGYDDWDEVLDMDGGALDTLVARVQFAPNHGDRFLQYVRRCKLKQRRGMTNKQATKSTDPFEDDCIIL
jgi:hypothetical protein|eukprot:Transcript_26630.p3 GENE.Transcript_26630~~Transcript_26630.p3  ORF type:complete len:200 (-),score=58.73 Transcript_26630:1604-2203(-)